MGRAEVSAVAKSQKESAGGGLSPIGLVWRSVRHFWGLTAAAVAGVAVATAVLVGAMLVGDSVRGSLTDLAVGRLGPVDQALISAQHTS